MRVQPHLPSRPFTAIATESSGRARFACSAAKRPAPPLPRMRMSVRALLTAPGPGFRSGPCLEDPETRDVRGAVGAPHLAERLHGALLLPGAKLGFAQEELRIVGALEAALLDALLDERDALGRVALVHVVH